MAGYPAPVAMLAAAADLAPSRVVEDAAHGLGAALDGHLVGADSRAACLSFYATKNLPISEGGAVVTSDAHLAETVRQTRLHGMSRDAWRRYLPGGSWRYDVDTTGLKANLTDVQAAIGRAQLHYLPAWQRRRNEIATRYDENLAGIPGLRLPVRPPGGTHAWHLYQVRVQPAFGMHRDQLAVSLGERGIGTSVHFIPVHTLTHFAQFAPVVPLPVTEAAFAEVLSLPLHPALRDSDVDVVCGAIRALASLRTGRA